MGTTDQKSVLVVGASRGIGGETARQFVQSGDHVVGTHRGSGIDIDGVHDVKMDLRDPDSIDAAVGEIESHQGAPEIVVCNAGINRDQLLIRMSEDDYREVIETNQLGAFRVVKRVLPAMLKAKGGSIVFVSSASAAAGQAGQANYAASKAALEGFARSIAQEYGKKGIRSNVVMPGPTETDMVAELSEKQREAMVAQVPMGRLAQPSEIAEVVESVSRATYMTGATVPVTGGAAIGL